MISAFSGSGMKGGLAVVMIGPDHTADDASFDYYLADLDDPKTWLSSGVEPVKKRLHLDDGEQRERVCGRSIGPSGPCSVNLHVPPRFDPTPEPSLGWVMRTSDVAQSRVRSSNARNSGKFIPLPAAVK